MPIISIIIPNYNSGDLLLRCVKSIIDNNADIQIIIVDDGSTDNSVRKVANLDDRIEIVKQSNQGVSTARNNGLEHVSGEYIMFVDADDCLDPKWAYYVLPKLKSGEDLFLFNYFSGNKNIQIIDHTTNLIGTEFANYRLKMLSNPTKFMTVWGKVLRTAVIKLNHLTFNPQLRLAEDGDFMVRYLIYIHNLYLSDKFLYHYLDNKHSVMRSFDPNKVNDYLKALAITKQVIVQINNSALSHAYSFYILMHLNVMMVRDVFNIDNHLLLTGKIKRLKNTLNKPLIKEALNDVKFSECHSLRMMPILLLKLKMYQLAALTFTLRSKRNHR